MASEDERPTAVGAFVFAGGFTLGVQQHLRVLAHLEEGNFGVATARRNLPDVPVHVGPPASWPLGQLAGVNVVYGNPPCAAWSQANQSPRRARDWRGDDRVNCTRRHLELLSQLRPRAWVWESVARAFTAGREFVDEVTAVATGQGYDVTYLLHDARWLGVPQKRPRFFFVAHDFPFHPSVPAWEQVTVGDALRGINDPGGAYKNGIDKEQFRWLLPQVRQGENMWAAYNRLVPEDQRELGARGQVVGRPAFLYRRPRPDEPSCVVMNDKLHPTEDRAMTIRELAALCGFPPLFEVVGGSPLNQLARGVCPPVGAWLAGHLAAGLRAGRLPDAGSRVRLIDLSRPPGTVVDVTRDGQPAGAAETSGPIRPLPAPALNGDGTSRRERPPKPRNGVRRIAFLQWLIMTDRYTNDQLVEIVRGRYVDARTSLGVVSDQRQALRLAGHAVPLVRRVPLVELNWER